MARSFAALSAPLRRRMFPGSPGLTQYLFAFVLVVRLVALTRLTSSPFLLASGSDMHFYDDWAKQILQGKWTDHHAFYGLPLYPFLLAGFYRLFGSSAFVPGFFQACADAATAVLICKIARRILTTEDRPKLLVTFAATATGVGWCFFVPAQAYSIILMPTSWAVFVLWLLVWQIVRTPVAPSLTRLLVFGLLIGITAMAVAAILFVVPLFLWAIFVRPTTVAIRSTQSTFRFRIVATLVLLSGIVAGTSPCWLHNYLVARDRVFLSAHGGINLWLGNNPEANGYPRFPGLHAGQSQMLRDSIALAEAAAGRPLKRSEVSDYWAAQARSYVTQNFVAWLKLMAVKVANFWNGFEYDDVGVIAALREYRIVFPGPSFAVIAAVGLPGLLVGVWKFPNSRAIAGAILLHMAAVLPVFITERYRVAVAPGLLIFGTVGLAELWMDCSLLRFRRIAAYFILLAGALSIVTMPRPDPVLWATHSYNLGRTALDSGDLSRAERYLSDAHTYASDNPEINFALANLRLAQGNRTAALSLYATVLGTDPNHKGALNNLGVLALGDGKFAEAAQYFRKSLELEPKSAKTYYLLATAELSLGDFGQAKVAIAHALEIDPSPLEYRDLREKIERHGQ